MQHSCKWRIYKRFNGKWVCVDVIVGTLDEVRDEIAQGSKRELARYLFVEEEPEDVNGFPVIIEDTLGWASKAPKG